MSEGASKVHKSWNVLGNMAVTSESERLRNWSVSRFMSDAIEPVEEDTIARRWVTRKWTIVWRMTCLLLDEEDAGHFGDDLIVVDQRDIRAAEDVGGGDNDLAGVRAAGTTTEVER